MKNNPLKGFSEADIIKKFHWLIENGLTIENAAKTIKEQTNVQNVINYVNNFLKKEQANG